MAVNTSCIDQSKTNTECHSIAKVPYRKRIPCQVNGMSVVVCLLTKPLWDVFFLARNAASISGWAAAFRARRRPNI